VSSLALRILAVLSMIIDHLGYACGQAGLLPEPVVIGMRLVGRLAMPIFCLLIAEGLFHTRDVRIYAGRLLLFGLISEIPFDLFCTNGQRFVRWDGQNVFFTLFLGLAAIWLCDRFMLRGRYVLALLGVLSCAMMAELAHTDYGMFGVLFIFVFYCFRDQPKTKCLAFAGVCLLMGCMKWISGSSLVWSVTMAGAAAAVIPIWLYNGRKGKSGHALQIAFYVFYPLHLLLIASLMPY